MNDPTVTAASGNQAKQVYFRLLGYTRRYWLMLVAGLIGVLLDAVAQPAFIRLMKPLIDEVFGAKNIELGKTLALWVLLIGVVRVIGNFVGVYGMQWVGSKVVADLRQELFTRYLYLPSAYFDRHSGGRLISKLTYNTQQVTQAATTSVTSAIRDVVMTIGLIATMLSANFKLSVAVLIMVPVVGLIVAAVSRRFRKISSRIQDSMGDVTNVTEEAVSGHKVVKIFQGQETEEKRFSLVNDKTRRLFMRLTATHLISSSLVQIAATIAFVMVIVIAIQPSMLQSISAGDFSVVFFAMLATIPPLKRLTSVQAEMQKGIAAADSIFQVLDTEAEMDTGTLEVSRVDGALEFRNVGFRYPSSDRPVLQDVSFQIPKGTVTALVGQSGSGKTTLAGLIPRFYQYSEGHIILDGKELSTYTLESLRSQVALVSQDVVLFNDTVAGNIAYGRLADASEEDIRNAAETAHAMEFIQQLPEGMNTQVGENGTLLSGGQRQRLAIARALLKDAPILILDEATSALDSGSERAIQEALTEVMKHRTTIVIAHRLSTIENADQVVVLDEGKIIEVGTHQELLDKNGSYANLYRIQFAEQQE